MLEDKDIQKLIEVFVTKDDLKEATEVLATRKALSDLQESIDAYAQKADAYFQEMLSSISKSRSS